MFSVYSLWMVLILFENGLQISDRNCLRNNPRVFDADLSFINRFGNDWEIPHDDFTKHIAVFVTRFNRAHHFNIFRNGAGSKNFINVVQNNHFSAMLEMMGKGVSAFRNFSKQEFHVFLYTFPGIPKGDAARAIRLYKKDYDTIMEINSRTGSPFIGIYIQYLTNTFEMQLEVVNFVFKSKPSPVLKIGHAFRDCLAIFRNTAGLKYMQVLDFISCGVYPVKKRSPEESAQDVISTCDQLGALANSINITAEIMCRVSYPSYGISPDGSVRSVEDFQRFWCEIAGKEMRNQHQPRIIMWSAFDKYPDNYQSNLTDLRQERFHNGWWRKRLENSYAKNGFVEKVEEIKGGSEHGSCTAECILCTESKQCCENLICNDDLSFQPFEGEGPVKVCQSNQTACAPRPPIPPLVEIPPAIPSVPPSSIITSVVVFITLICTVLLVVGGVGFFISRRKKPKQIITMQEFQHFFYGCSPRGGFFEDQFDSNEIVDDLPYDKSLEIPISNFKIDEGNILGSGAFGVVLMGQVLMEDVAVKMILPGVSNKYLKALLLELKILTHLGAHENIVNMRGAYTAELLSGKLYLFLELCPLGNLLAFLKSHRENLLENLTLQTRGTPPTPKDLLMWSLQIATAMRHLVEKRVIHGDIAARNVLIFSMDQVKLTDFGLSRRLFEYSNYVKKKQEPLPWRHMSVEALQDFTFSEQSDVWSFGVTMWEMFSMGTVPYPGQSLCQNFIQCLVNGMRLPRPQYAHPIIYEVMNSCWTIDVQMRPPISSIHSRLASALEELYANPLYLRPS